MFDFKSKAHVFRQRTVFLPVVGICFVPLQIDAFQHMQHFVQGMQQQAQHAIAAEDQQHKLELHKLMARSAPMFTHSSTSSVFSQEIFSLLWVGKADSVK